MHNSLSRRVRHLAFLAVLFGAAPVLAADAPADKRVGAVGPDVTVFNLSDIGNSFAASNGIKGYAVGTVSCNVGDTPLNWCDQSSGCAAGATSHDHPVIAQNMYRLHNGRFDQVGSSWLKHGFLSTNSTSATCAGADGQSCTRPPAGDNQLGVGCTDPYGAGLNGSRPLGRKSEVNPTTGAYPFPFGQGGSTTENWNQRLAVALVDLNTTTQPGARFFVEGHYVAPDDAMMGNGLNNASYREVSANQSNFNLAFVGTTVRAKAAIEVWPVIDPTVELVNVDTPTTPVERFHVARKVTQPSPGLWHYEYAVHNMNSDRSASRLTVRFFGNTTFSGLGFHDVNAHSNEPYDTTDWPGTAGSDTVEWQAPAFASSPSNGNAIRWGTQYNFWFDATRPPTDIDEHVIGLFKAGTPSEIKFLEGTDSLLVDSFE